MQTEIAKKQKCLLIMGGIEIWLEEDQSRKLSILLAPENAVNLPKFILIGKGDDERVVQTSTITGIFLPLDLEDLKRRKNGQWKCEYGEWHNRGENCECHKKKIAKDKQNKLNAQLAGGDVSEEQRIKNLDKFRGMKSKIFN